MREITATDVSRIGTASKSIGVANEAAVESSCGSSLIANDAIKIPRNKAPASPIYIRAGLLFQSKNPIVDPVITTDKAAIKN